MQSNQLLDKLKDSVTSRNYAGDVGVFIDGIKDEINWGLSWELEHEPQPLHKRIIIGLLGTGIMFHV
jgi:hypothetical protein